MKRLTFLKILIGGTAALFTKPKTKDREETVLPDTHPENDYDELYAIQIPRGFGKYETLSKMAKYDLIQSMAVAGAISDKEFKRMLEDV